MWQSRVENVHYSGSQLLRKTCLKLGVICAYLATFRYELGSYCHRMTLYDSERWLGYPQNGSKKEQKLIVVSGIV